MVPDDTSEPFDLEAMLDEARDRGDGDAAIAFLERILADPPSTRDYVARDYLDGLVDAYDMVGRQREAIEALGRIAERQPDLAGDVTDVTASLYARLGESDAAMTLVRRRYAEQQALPAAQRDIDFYAAGAMTVGELVGDLDLARRLLSDGQDLALEQDSQNGGLRLALVEARLFPEDFAKAFRDELDGLIGTRSRSRLRPGSPAVNLPAQRPPLARQVMYRMAYLPEAQYAIARRQGLLDATMYPRHEDYRREIQQTIKSVATHQGASVSVVALDVAGLVDYAAREGKDPASRATRLDYSNTLDSDGRDIAWPPQRNAPCWCGSDRKYKKCCGAPEFLAVEAPDPASLVLRIELDHVAPPVWRRVAAPSNMTLDRLHRVIQDAMGWQDQHMYVFENDEVTIIDPRSHSPAIKADGERLVGIANEVGQRFSYVYDFGDGWRHTVILEEIREAGPENIPKILAGEGACPPEDCGGPAGYLTLVRALEDTTHPDHDEAVDRLGENFDPAAYRPHATVGGHVS